MKEQQVMCNGINPLQVYRVSLPVLVLYISNFKWLKRLVLNTWKYRNYLS